MHQSSEWVGIRQEARECSRSSMDFHKNSHWQENYLKGPLENTDSFRKHNPNHVRTSQVVPPLEGSTILILSHGYQPLNIHTLMDKLWQPVTREQLKGKDLMWHTVKY